MDWTHWIYTHADVTIVSVVLVWAAWIDGKQLRVPNWMTYSMILAGLIVNSVTGGWDGFTFGLWGMTVGLLTLMPLYAVGGMGAGDVKLMAGIGAWLGAAVTWNAFLVSTVVGGLMAIAMVLYRKTWAKHYGNFWMILHEFKSVKNPAELSRIAAERKPQMLLLPYGIPICIGSLAYFAWHYTQMG